MNEKTIGELSRFTGVSVHTIKYYEKIGLLTSSRKEHSNYRSYNVRICTDIYECLKYRNMDFSLKDTGVLLREVDDEMVRQMLDARSAELEEEMAEAVRKIFRQYGDAFPADAYGVRIKITHDEEGNDWNYMKVFVPLH